MAFIPLVGCGPDNTPTAPAPASVQQYLEEHPEAMEYAEEEETDEDDGSGE